MGLHFADQYSILHFSVGTIAYFWNIPFLLAFLLHVIYELIENTPLGMNIINTYFVSKAYFSWPGEKNYPDSITNIIGDCIFFGIGWIFSSYFDNMGIKNKWYNKCIVI